MATDKKPTVKKKRPVALKTLYDAIEKMVDDTDGLQRGDTIDDLLVAVKEAWFTNARK